jgi:uncharacterized membrane protein YciS (DUF1049 family)
MIRTLYLTLVLVIAAMAAAVFAWLNPGDITLDVAFASVTVPIPLAFATAVAIGWAFGWLSVAVIMARLKANQFFLRRRLRHATDELNHTRRLPGAD